MNAIVLKPANEERFNKIYATFAKSEPNAMRFSQFMQFLLDRCLISNKNTLKHFYILFQEATHKRILKETSPPNNPMFENIIKKQELIYLFNELGKYMYHKDKAYQDKLYNELLSEKVVAEKDAVLYSRVMIFDELNRKMFLENAVETLATYEDELKNLYLIYIDENYFAMKKQQRILLNHRQVELQNKTMSAVAFVRFLKAAEIIPHLVNIEQFQQILSRVVPPSTPKENQFFYKHILVDFYSKNIENVEFKHPGDPGLILFEFIVTIARIAIETCKQADSTKKTYDNILVKFFKDHLNIRTNEQLAEKVPFQPHQRLYHKKLYEYYTIEKDQFGGGFKVYEPEIRNPFEVLGQMESELNGLKPIDFDIVSMLNILQNQIPSMPEKIQINQQLPPPFPKKFKTLDKVAIGQQPPPQNKEKKGIKPPPKKPMMKDIPKRKFQFQKQEVQTKKHEAAEDHLQKLSTQLDYALKPLASLDRGTIPLDPFPSLISQVLYPTEVPQHILPYLEAGLNAQAQNMYALAIQNISKAHELWIDVEGQPQLKANLQLYFQYTIGGIYQSAGRDDYAFNAYFNCRAYGQRLPFLSPDRALPFCGMGEALFNGEEYQMATRCFLKAREIRQKLLGIQAIDTATVFNNLGCCFFMQDRNKQALGYFKISHSVLVAELGEYHERTQAAKENIALCNKSFYVNIPEYRKLWVVYEHDPYAKAKKKKKKKKQ